METDYISREAAINDVKNLDDTMFVCVSKDECNGMRSMKKRAVSALDRIPAADVRPVVRCGECIRKDICRSSNIWAVSPDDNWFCADGERRDGGTP